MLSAPGFSSSVLFNRIKCFWNPSGRPQPTGFGLNRGTINLSTVTARARQKNTQVESANTVVSPNSRITVATAQIRNRPDTPHYPRPLPNASSHGLGNLGNSSVSINSHSFSISGMPKDSFRSAHIVRSATTLSNAIGGSPVNPA